MKKIFYTFAVAAGTTILISGFALTASAQTNTVGVGLNASATVTTTVLPTIGTNVSAKVLSIITTAVGRADTEITRRITALNALETRVNAMVKLSADEKSSLSTTIQAQVTVMNTLQGQIATAAATDSTSSLKLDIQSITKSYRIFALIIPQGAIEAAADRVLDVSSMLTTISGKLQTRISTLPAGTDTTSLDASLSDMNTQIANANTLVNAAISEITNLQPDNGVASVMASNTATLKDARSKIVSAQQDLLTARKDAGAIVKALVSTDTSANTSASVSASTSASTSAQ